ncbi:MAG TPA: cbb3-type cytochrome c oxidase subunit I, partial [Polyangiaceae bacterium]|nr:cbb3-type cytochrome c oxidase subunit I [Polyangiaceae bacterium]
MTTAVLPFDAAPAPSVEEVNYLRDGTTIRSWLLTRDHKRIAIMFFCAVNVSLLLGGIFALLLRLELLTPERTIMSATTYNRMFTMHGIVMVFMFMIPSIPAVFGNFMLPLMLGAKDVAFPRLNLASFYVYLFGAGLTLWSLIAGGADMGWTFYAPYSTTTPSAVAPIGLGVFVLGLSSIMTGLNFIVTTHTLRARGLGFWDLPLFVWSIYATSVIQLLATPVLGLSLLV